jgi:hypothetical protein
MSPKAELCPPPHVVENILPQFAKASPDSSRTLSDAVCRSEEMKDMLVVPASPTVRSLFPLIISQYQLNSVAL